MKIEIFKNHNLVDIQVFKSQKKINKFFKKFQKNKIGLEPEESNIIEFLDVKENYYILKLTY